MSVIQRVRNAYRLNQILGVALKYGFAQVVDQVERVQRGLVRRLRRGEDAPDPQLAGLSEGERLRRTLEELGPTFVKVGQLLSSRKDLVPDWALVGLQKLQDDVEPVPFEQIRSQVERELGKPLHELFAVFEREPIGTASLGQVHLATRLGGERVAVKVQRPDIERLVLRDLDVLVDLCEVLNGRVGGLQHLDLPSLAEDLSQALRDELVYTIEGRNTERVAGQLEPADQIRIPKIHWDLTTRRVLCSEYLAGDKLREAELDEAQKKDLAKRLADFMLRQILIDGFFHTDPHPGNLIVLTGGELGIVDWGQVGLLSSSMRESLGEIFIAIVTQDIERLAEEICHLGMIRDDSDLEKFRHDVARSLDRYFYLAREEFPIAELLQRILELSYENRLQLPAEIPLLIKVLVTVEGTCQALDPEFDLRQAFEPVVKRLIGARLEPGRVVREMASGVRQLNRLATTMPRQMAGILGRLEAGSLRLHVEDQRLDEFAGAVQAAVNRFTLAIMTLALLVSGSLVYPHELRLGASCLVAGLVCGTMVVLAIARSRRL